MSAGLIALYASYVSDFSLCHSALDQFRVEKLTLINAKDDETSFNHESVVLIHITPFLAQEKENQQ